jgi:hypothetical protein
MITRPLAIDLFCGLGGWTDGLLAEGFEVIGFDIERHVYGEHKYPAQLVIQDVLTVHGSQFRHVDLIVASPPCQEYSYMAMPWSRAKKMAAEYRSGERDVKKLTALFDACFRIQREACEAAGRHIPMVLENVRGAIPWVGRSRYNYGSFHLWGDVPALMPQTARAVLKNGVTHRANGSTNFHQGAYDGAKNPGFRFDGSGKSFQSESVERHTDASGYKSAGLNWSDQSKRGQDFTRIAGEQSGVKVPSETGRRTAPGNGARFTSRDCGVEASGTKNGKDWFGSGDDCSLQRRAGSKTSARKFASAMIAKIPTPLSRHIARTFKPDTSRGSREQQ